MQFEFGNTCLSVLPAIFFIFYVATSISTNWLWTRFRDASMAASHCCWRAPSGAFAGHADWLPPSGKQCRKALHPQNTAAAIVSRSIRVCTFLLPLREFPESKWISRKKRSRRIEIGRDFSTICGFSLRNIAVAVFWKPIFSKS